MMPNQRLEEIWSQLDSSSLVDDIIYSVYFFYENFRRKRPDFNVSSYRRNLECCLENVRSSDEDFFSNLNGFSSVFQEFKGRLCRTKDFSEIDLKHLFELFVEMNVLQAKIPEEINDIERCRDYASRISLIRQEMHDVYHETNLYRAIGKEFLVN